MKRMIGFLMMVGLMVSVVGFGGCGGDSDSPTGPQGQTLEVETEKWDNGNIKVEFQYYRDGGSVIKHGFYKEYSEPGQITLESNYKGGQLHGVYKEYSEDENGTVIHEGEYKDGIKWNGTFVESSDKQTPSQAQITIESNYKEGKLHGSYKGYNKFGTVYLAEYFDDEGEEHEITFEGEYKEGIEWSGTFFEFWDNGQLRSHVNYQGGVFHGLSIDYQKDGSDRYRGIYKEGVPWSGTFVSWWDNEHPRSVVNYYDGQLHGLSIEYSENGKIETEVNYINGEANRTPETSVIALGSDGSEIFDRVWVGETIILDGTGSWDEDGDELMYEWKIHELPSISSVETNSMIESPTFTFRPTEPGIYIFELWVNDGKEFGRPESIQVQADHFELYKSLGPIGRQEVGHRLGVRPVRPSTTHSQFGDAPISFSERIDIYFPDDRIQITSATVISGDLTFDIRNTYPFIVNLELSLYDFLDADANTPVVLIKDMQPDDTVTLFVDLEGNTFRPENPLQTAIFLSASTDPTQDFFSSDYDLGDFEGISIDIIPDELIFGRVSGILDGLELPLDPRGMSTSEGRFPDKVMFRAAVLEISLTSAIAFAGFIDIAVQGTNPNGEEATLNFSEYFEWGDPERPKSLLLYPRVDGLVEFLNPLPYVEFELTVQIGDGEGQAEIGPDHWIQIDDIVISATMHPEGVLSGRL